MRYAEQRHRESVEEEAYRLYMAEQERLRGEGKYIPRSLTEILHPRPEYDAEAVKAGVIERAGLEVENESA